MPSASRFALTLSLLVLLLAPLVGARWPGSWPVEHEDFAGLGPVLRYDQDMGVLGTEGFSFEHVIDGISNFVISYSTGWFHYGDDYPILWIHEWFHHWQSEQQGWYRVGLWRPGFPYETEDLAMVLLERRVLRAGVEAATPEEKQEALATFHAIRSQRRADCPWIFETPNYNVWIPEVGYPWVTRHVFDIDEEGERFEGTAMYVEREYAARAGIPRYTLPFELSLIDSTAYYQDSELLFDLLFDRSGWYAVGAALGRLLDAVPGLDWKAEMKGGTSQAGVAAQLHASMSAAERAARIAAARSAHDWNGIVASIEALPAAWCCSPGHPEKCCPVP